MPITYPCDHTSMITGTYDQQHYQWSSLTLVILALSMMGDGGYCLRVLYQWWYDDGDYRPVRWPFHISFHTSPRISLSTAHQTPCDTHSHTCHQAFINSCSFQKVFTFLPQHRKFFSSSINIAVVLSDLLGFTLVFVDSLAFGIRDCFTLLLVRLQREFQMPTIWQEYANNSLSSWTASAKSWLTCEQTSSSTVLHESWNGNF